MFFKDVRRWMQGAPDSALTIYLVIVALITAMIAFFGPPEMKLVTLVWLVAP